MEREPWAAVWIASNGPVLVAVTAVRKSLSTEKGAAAMRVERNEMPMRRFEVCIMNEVDWKWETKNETGKKFVGQKRFVDQKRTVDQKKFVKRYGDVVAGMEM